MYQNKVQMDLEILDLVQTMDQALSFVDDTAILQQKLTKFLETIEEVLRMVEECSTCIQKYLESSLAG